MLQEAEADGSWWIEFINFNICKYNRVSKKTATHARRKLENCMQFHLHNSNCSTLTTLCTSCRSGYTFCIKPLVISSNFFPLIWSGFCCDYMLLSKMNCDESCHLWMKGVFPSLLQNSILPSELSQPFSTCRQSLLVAPHIGFLENTWNHFYNSLRFPLTLATSACIQASATVACKPKSYRTRNRSSKRYDVIGFSFGNYECPWKR